MTQNPSFRIFALCVSCAIVAACESAKPPASERVEKAKPAAANAPSQQLLPPLANRQDVSALTATAPKVPSSLLGASSDDERDTKAEPAKLEEEASAKVDFPSMDTDEAPLPDRPLDPGEVQVDRFLLTTDVQGREPVDERYVFDTETPKIFAFMQLANPDGAPYTVRVHFERADGPATPYGIDLAVESLPRYRTWAYTRIRREPGMYRAVLRTLDGKEIDSRTFEIVAAE